jgi:hypothetical protein
MALRLHGWKRRLLGLGAGLLICAGAGCKTPKETQGPALGQNAPLKPMGAGNTVANPPTSPAFNNLAGNPTMNNGGTTFNNSPPYVNPPVTNAGRPMNTMSPGVVPMPNFTPPQNQAAFGSPSMQMQQVPNYGQNVPPQQFGQPVAPANYGQMPQNGYPQGMQGYPQQQAPVYQQGQVMQAPQMPQTQIINGPGPQLSAPVPPPLMNTPNSLPLIPAGSIPLSSRDAMQGLKVPEAPSTSLTGVDSKGLPTGSQLLPVSGSGPTNDVIRADARLPQVNVMDLSPKRVNDAPVEAPVEAPVTIFPSSK